LNDLASQLAAHDIVVSSTASPLPIIGKGLESALKAQAPPDTDAGSRGAA
jgi:glutamyl-tRNA reductase